MKMYLALSERVIYGNPWFLMEQDNEIPHDDKVSQMEIITLSIMSFFHKLIHQL
jgi:hypothetical protein